MNHPKKNGKRPSINELEIISKGGCILSLIGGVEYNIPKMSINKPINMTRILTNRKRIKPNIDNINALNNIFFDETNRYIIIPNFPERISNFLSKTLFIRALEVAMQKPPIILIIEVVKGKQWIAYHSPNKKNIIPVIHPIIFIDKEYAIYLCFKIWNFELLIFFTFLIIIINL